MIILNDKQYELIKDERSAFDLDTVKEHFTDYFEIYDYVVGDWAYGKLRLKGFYDKDNKKATKINSYENIKDYIENYCAYGCKYFIIKKI